MITGGAGVRLSVLLAALSLGFLVPLNLTLGVPEGAALAVAFVAFVTALIAGSLGTIGLIRAGSLAVRLGNGGAVALALLGLLAWGSVLFQLTSGCLAITC